MPVAAISSASSANSVSSDAVRRRGASELSRISSSVRTASTGMSGSIACTAAVARFASTAGSTVLRSRMLPPPGRLRERDVEHVDRILVERVIAHVAGDADDADPAVAAIAARCARRWDRRRASIAARATG